MLCYYIENHTQRVSLFEVLAQKILFRWKAALLMSFIYTVSSFCLGNGSKGNMIMPD